ncbi:titin-like [Lucilia sericata]|uniref:titin-like n=1 Tax=Lucilia sericata TaxID=13632 RepID=UPI0018A80D27|nr:titin-like [Lucilia sericata]
MSSVSLKTLERKVLAAQPVDPDLTAKLLGRGVAVSPIVTVEPRRRKFHKAITLSMPAPKAHSQGMINQYSGNTPTLRLLCSITGGPSRAQWEDVTGSTPLTFVNDCVSFTTTVSARFWLMDCRNISEATKMATELYKEVIHVPFIAKFVVFAKKVEPFEARLRVFCMTDDREDKTLEKMELYTQVAKSRDVEVLEGKPQYIEMAGNLVPVTKSGEQLQLPFKAFRENRLPFTVRVKDQHADIVGRTLFMKEPKVAKGEPPQHPICILNIVLPEAVIPDSVTAFSDKITPTYRSSLLSFSKHQNDHYIGDIRIVDLSNLLGKDWIQLASEIDISTEEVDEIINQNTDSIARQAQSMIRLYKDKPNYDIHSLEQALKNIGRDDIMNKCKSGRLSHSRDFDETDIMKNSESVEELVRQESKRIQQIHEREEIKYSAEEKEIEESESDEEIAKRTVAERRDKIVKRLSVERQIPASSQKKEITREITEIKRKSLIEDKKAIHESEIFMQLPADNSVKSAVVPEQVIKMKMGKIDSTEVSKSDFDKELTHKFKSSSRSSEEEPEVEDTSSARQLGHEEVDNLKIVKDITSVEKPSKIIDSLIGEKPSMESGSKQLTEDFLAFEKLTQLPSQVLSTTTITTTTDITEKFVEEVKEKSDEGKIDDEIKETAAEVVTETMETASKKVESIISSFESSKPEKQPSTKETLKGVQDFITAERKSFVDSAKTFTKEEETKVEESIVETKESIISETISVKDKIKAFTETKLDDISDKIASTKDSFKKESTKVEESLKSFEESQTDAIESETTKLTEEISSEIKSVSDAIKTFSETQVKELKSETAKIDKNILQTKDSIATATESTADKIVSFVDTKTNELQTETAALQSLITDTKDTKISETINILQTTKDFISSETKNITEAFKSKIDEVKKETEETKEHVIDKKDSLISESKSVAETIKAFNEPKIEDVKIAKESIVKETKSLFDKSTEEFKEQLSEAKETVISETQSVSETIKAFAEPKLEDIKKETSKVETKVEFAKDSIDKQFKEQVHETKDTIITETKSVAETIKVFAEPKADDIKKEASKIESKLEETKTFYDKSSEEFKEHVADMKDGIVTETKSVTETIKAFTEPKLDDFKKETAKLETEMTSTKDSIVKETKSLFDTKTDEFKKHVEEKKDSFVTETKSVAETIKTFSEPKIEDIKKTTSELDSKVDLAKESIVQQTESYYDTKSEEIKEYVSDKKDSIITETKTVAETIKAFTEPKIDDIKKEPSKVETKVGFAKDSIVEETRTQFDKKSDEVEHLISDTKETLVRETKSVTETIKAFTEPKIEDIKKDTSKVETKVSETFIAATKIAGDTIETKTQDFKLGFEEMKDKLSDTEDFIITETKTVAETIKSFSEPKVTTSKIEEKFDDFIDSTKKESKKVSETIKSLSESFDKSSAELKFEKEKIIPSDKIEDKIADFEAKKVTYEYHGLEPKLRVGLPTTTKAEDEKETIVSAPEAAPRKITTTTEETTFEESLEKLEEMKSIVADARKITKDFLSMEQQSQLPLQTKVEMKEESRLIEETIKTTITFPPIVEKTVTETVTKKIEEQVESKPETKTVSYESALKETVEPSVQETVLDSRKLTHDFLSMEQKSQLPCEKQTADDISELSTESSQHSVEKSPIIETDSEKISLEHFEKADIDARKITHDFLSMEQKQQPFSPPKAKPHDELEQTKPSSIIDEVLIKATDIMTTISAGAEIPKEAIPSPKEEKIEKEDSKSVLKSEQLKDDGIEMAAPIKDAQEMPASVVKTLTQDFLTFEQSVPMYTTPKTSTEEPKTSTDRPEDTFVPTTSDLTDFTHQRVIKMTGDFLSMEQTTHKPQKDTSVKPTDELMAPIPIEPRKSLTDAEFCKSVQESITKKMSEGLIEISDELKIKESDIPHSQTPPPTPIETKIEKEEEEVIHQKPTMDEDNVIDTIKTLHKTTESTFERVSTISTIEHFSIQNIKPYASSSATFSTIVTKELIESKKLPKEMLEIHETPTSTTKIYHTKDTPSFTEMSESSRTKTPKITTTTTTFPFTKSTPKVENENIPSGFDKKIATMIELTPSETVPVISDRDYLEQIMKCGDVKRKIQELETQGLCPTDISKQSDSESESIDKNASVKTVVHAIEEKIIGSTVEAIPFAVRKRQGSHTECDLPQLEKQILNEVDVALTQLTTSEPPIDVVKLSPIEATEKEFSNMSAIDEVVCEKICQKKKTFEVAEEPTKLDKFVKDTNEMNISDDIVKYKEIDAITGEMPKNDNDTLPKVREVVEVFEKKFPTSTVEAIPFSPRRREKRPTDLDTADVEKQILTETDLLLEKLAPTITEKKVQVPTINSPQQTTTPIEETCEVVCSQRRISELAKLFEVPSETVQNQTQEYDKTSLDKIDSKHSDTIETEKTVNESQLPKLNLTSNQTSIIKPLEYKSTTLPLGKPKTIDNKPKFSISNEMWDNKNDLSTDSHLPTGSEITAHVKEEIRKISTVDQHRTEVSSTLVTGVSLTKTSLEIFSITSEQPTTLVVDETRNIEQEYTIRREPSSFPLFKSTNLPDSPQNGTDVLMGKIADKITFPPLIQKSQTEIESSNDEQLKQIYENHKIMSLLDKRKTNSIKNIAGNLPFDNDEPHSSFPISAQTKHYMEQDKFIQDIQTFPPEQIQTSVKTVSEVDSEDDLELNDSKLKTSQHLIVSTKNNVEDKPKSPLDLKKSDIKPTTIDDSDVEIELEKPRDIESKPSMPQIFSDLPESLDKSDKPKSSIDSKTSPIKPTYVADSEDELELKEPTAVDPKPSIPSQFSDLPESLDKSDKPKSPVDSKTSPAKPTSVDDSEDKSELKKPIAIDSELSMPPQFSDLPESLNKSAKLISPTDLKMSPIKPTSVDDSEDEIDSKPTMPPQFSDLPESLDKSDKPKSTVDSKTSFIKPTSADDNEAAIELKKSTAIDSKPSMPTPFSELPDSLDKSDKPKPPADSKVSPIKPTESSPSVNDSEDAIELKKPEAIALKPSIPKQFSDLQESLDKSEKSISPIDSKTASIKPTSVDDNKDEIKLKKPTATDSKPSMPTRFSELPEFLDKSAKPKSPVDSQTSPVKQTSGDSEDKFELKKPTAIDSKPSMLPQFSELPESLEKSDKPKSPVDSKTFPIKPTSFDDSEDEIELKRPTVTDSKPSLHPQFSELTETLDKSDKPNPLVDSKKISPIKPISVDDTKDESELKKPTAIDSKPSIPPQFFDLPESLDKSDKPKSPVDSKTSPIKPSSADDSEDKFELKKPTAIDSKHSIPPQFSELPESLDKLDKPNSPVDSKTSPIKPTSFDVSEDEIELKKPTAIDSKSSIPPQFSDLPESLDKSEKPKSPVASKMSPIKPTSFDDSEDEIDLKKPTAIDSKPSIPPQFSELPESLDKSDKPKSPAKPTSFDDSEDEIELKKPTAIDLKTSIPPQFSDLPQSLDKSDKPKLPVDSKTFPIKPISVDDSEDETELKKPTDIDSKPSMTTQFSELQESSDKSDKPKSPVDSKISPTKQTHFDDSVDEIELKKPTAIDSKPSIPPQFSELLESLDKSDKPKSPKDSKTFPITLIPVDDSEDETELKKPTDIDSKPSMTTQFSELPESLDKSDKPKSHVDSKISPIKPTSFDGSEDEIESEDVFELRQPTAIDAKPSMLPQFSELPESLDSSDKPKSSADSKISPIKPTSADDSEDEIELKKPTDIALKHSIPPQFSDLPESLDKSDKPKSPVDSKTSPIKATSAYNSEDKFELKKPTGIDSKPSIPLQFSDLPESLDKSDKPKSPVDSKISPIKPISVDDTKDEIEIKKPTAIESKPLISPQFSDLTESLDKSDKQKSPLGLKTFPIKPKSVDDSEDESELKKPTAIDSKPSMLPQFSELPESLDKSDNPKSPVDSKSSPVEPTSADDSEDETELKKPTDIDSKPLMTTQFAELLESVDKSDKPKSPVDSKTSPAKPISVDNTNDEIELKNPTYIDSKPLILPHLSGLPESLDKSDKPKSPVDSKISPIKPTSFDDSEDEIELKRPTAIDSKPSMPPQFSELLESIDKSDKPKSPVDSKTSPIKPTSFDDSEDEIELKKQTAIDSKPSIPPKFSDFPDPLDKSDKPKSPVDTKTSPIKLISVDDSEDEFELKKPTASGSKPSMLPQFSDLPESLDKSDKPKSPVDSKTFPIKPTSFDDSEDEIELKKQTAIDSKPSIPPKFSDFPDPLDKSDKPKSPVDSKTSPIKLTSVDDSEDELELKKPTASDSKPSMLPQFSELTETLDKSDKPKSPVDSKTSPIKPTSFDDSEDENELKKQTAIDSKPSIPPKFSDFPDPLDKSDKPKSPVDSKTSPMKLTSVDDSEDEFELKKPTAIDSTPSMLPQFSELPESLDQLDKPKSPVDSKTSLGKPTSFDNSEDEIELKKPTAIDSKPSIPPQFSDLPKSLHKSDKPKSPVGSKTSPIKLTSADDSEDEFELKKPTAIDPKPSMLPQFSELRESLDKSDKPKSPVDSKTSLAKPTSFDDSEDKIELKKPAASDKKPSMPPQFSDLPESLDKSHKPKSPVDSKMSPIKLTSVDDSEDEFELKKPTDIDSKPSMTTQFSELPGSLDKSDKLKSPLDSKTFPIKPVSVDDSEDESELKKPTDIDSKPSKTTQFSELPESLDKSDKPKSPVDSKTSPAKPKSPVDSKTSPAKPTSFDDSEDEMELGKPPAIDQKPSMPPQFSELPESLDKSDKPKSPVDSKTSPIKPTSFDDSEDEFELKKPTATDPKPSIPPHFSDLPESLDKSDKPKSPGDSKTSPIKPTSADDSEYEFELKKPTATDPKPSTPPQFFDLPESLDKSDKPKSTVDSKISPIKPTSFDDSEDEIELKKPTATDPKPSTPPQFSDLPESLDKSDKPKSPVDSKTSPIKPISVDDTRDKIEPMIPTATDLKPSIPPQFSDLAESLDKSDKPKSPVDSKISPIKPTSFDDSEDEIELKKPTAIDSKPSIPPQFSDLPESLDKSGKPKSPIDSKKSPIKPTSFDDSEDEIELKKPTAIDSKPAIPPQFSELPGSLDKSDKPKSPVDSKISPIKPTSADDPEDEIELKKPTATDPKPSIPPQFSDLAESLDKSDKPKSPVDSKISPIKPTSFDDSEDEIELKKPTAIDSKPSIPPQFSDLPESLDKSDKPKSPVDSKTSPIKLMPAADTKDETELKKPTDIDSKHSILPQFSELPESVDKSDKPKSPIDSKKSPIKPTSFDDSEDEIELKKPTAIDSKPEIPPQFSELPGSLDKSDKPKSPVDSKTSLIKPTSADDPEDEIELKKPTATDPKPSIPPQFSDLAESLDKSDKPKSPVDSKISPIKPTSFDDSEDEIELKKPTAIDSKPSIPPQFSDLPEFLDKSDKPKSPVDSKTSPFKLMPAADTKDETELKKPTAIDSKPSMPPQFSDLPKSLDKSDKPKSPVNSKMSPIKPTSFDDSEDEIESEDVFELRQPTAIDAKPSMLPQFSELPESLDKSEKPKSHVDSKTSLIKLTSADDSEDEFELKKPTATDSKHSMLPQFSELPESLDKSDKPKSPVDSKTSPIKPISVDGTKDEIELKKPTATDPKPSIPPQFSDLAESLNKSDKPKSPVDSKISPIKPTSFDDSEDEIESEDVFELRQPTAIDAKPSMLPQFSELPESLDSSDKPKSPVDSKTSLIKLTSADDSEDEFELKKPTATDSKHSMLPQFSELPESLDKSDKPKSPVDSKTSPIKPISVDDTKYEIELKKPTAIDSKPSIPPQFSDLPESLDKSDKPKSPVYSKTSPAKPEDDSEDEFEIKKPTAIDSKPSKLPQFSELPESLDKSDKPKSPVDSKTSPIKPISVDDTKDEIELKKPTAIDSKPSIPPQCSDLPESLDKSDEPKSPVDSKTSPNKLTPVDDTKDKIELKKPTVSDSKPLMPPQFSDLPGSLDKSDKPKSPVDSKISPIKPISADDSEDKFDQKKPTAIDSKPSMLPQFSELPESLDKSDKPKSPVDSKTSSAKPADDSEDEIEIEKPTAIDSKPSMLPQFSELPESLDKSDKPKSPVYSKTSPAKPADVSEDEYEIKKPTAIDSKPSKLPQFSELPESLDKSDKPKSTVDSKTSPAKPADDSEDEFEIKKPTAIDSKPSMPPQFSDLPKSLDKSDKPKSPVNSKMSPIKPTSFDDSEDEIESEDVFELRQPTAIDAKPSMLPQFSELPKSLDSSDKPKSPVDSKTSLIKLTSADDSKDEFELKKPTATDSTHSMLPQFSELPESLDKSDKPKSPVDSKTSPIKLIFVDDTKDEIELKKPTAIDSKPSNPPQCSDLPESLDKSDEPKSPVDSKTYPNKLTSVDDTKDEIELKKPTVSDSKPLMPPQFSDLPESLDKSDKPKSPVVSKISPITPTSADDSKDKFDQKKPTAIDSKPSMLPQFSELPESLDKSDKPKSPVYLKTSPAKPADDSEDEFEIKKPTAIDSKPSKLPQFSELPESLDKSDKPKSPVDSKTSPAKPSDDSQDELKIKKPTAIDSKPSMPPQFSDLPKSLDKSDKPKSPMNSKMSPIKPTSFDDSEDEIESEDVFELRQPTAIDAKPSMLPQFSELPKSLDKSDKPKSPIDSKTSSAKPADDSEYEIEIEKPTAIDSKPSMLPQYSEFPESLDKSDK